MPSYVFFLQFGGPMRAGSGVSHIIAILRLSRSSVSLWAGHIDMCRFLLHISHHHTCVRVIYKHVHMDIYCICDTKYKERKKYSYIYVECFIQQYMMKHYIPLQ